MNTLITFIAAPCATFASTLLRGFQNRAVASNNKGQAFFVGALMNACDLLVITVIALHASAPIIAFSATGAGCGWLAGMYIHDRINRKRREALKLKKKEKRKRLVLKSIRKVLDETVEHERSN